MEHKLEIYRDLATLFDSKGFLLYLVGGTVRDYLLGKELTDMDLVTDATPSEMKEFLSNADYTFEKYGNINTEGEMFYGKSALNK